MSAAKGGVLIAAAAERLVGVPFRAGGRDATAGLDCVGVVLAAFAAAGAGAITTPLYTMRRTHLRPFDRLADQHGLRPVTGLRQPGDVVVCHVGPAQFHAAVAIDRVRAVHAHAGLRRVVCGPLPHEWTIVRHWRTLI